METRVRVEVFHNGTPCVSLVKRLVDQIENVDFIEKKFDLHKKKSRNGSGMVMKKMYRVYFFLAVDFFGAVK